MLIFGGILGFFAYLVIGNRIGHIMTEEFLDDTETQKLNWYKRLRRRLLFPDISRKWGSRIVSVDSGCPMGRLLESYHNDRDNYKLYNRFISNPVKLNTAISSYIAKSTWLWLVLRTPPAVFGIIFIVNSMIIGAVEYLFKSNDAGSRNNTPEAEKIRRFISEKLEPKRARLEELKTDTLIRKTDLAEVISEWEKLIGDTADGDQRKKFEQGMDQLKRDRGKLELEYKNLSDDALTLTACATNLNQGITALNLYARTRRIISELTDNDQNRQEADEILAFAKESMRIASEISELPRNVLMVEMDMRVSEDFSDLIESPRQTQSDKLEKLVH